MNNPLNSQRHIIDSHCHLDLVAEQPGMMVEDVIKYATAQQVTRLMCVGLRPRTYESMVACCKNQDMMIDISLGLHPCYQEDILDLDEFERLFQYHPPVAIGETGLDYYHIEAKSPWQVERFAQHIALARSYRKPLIIHTRAAIDDTLDMLRAHQAHECGGVMHCFSEGYEHAKKALDLGFYISFSGVITYKNAEDLRQVAAKLPLNRLLIETDSPYLAPVPMRGKTNQPGYLSHTATMLASIKGVSYEQLAQQTSANYMRLFHQQASVMR